MIATILTALGWAKAAYSFFTSPIGRALGMVALAGLLFLAGDIHRARKDAAAWRAKIEAAEQARVERDATIKAQVSKDANARMAVLAREKSDLENKVADYAKKLDANSACRVTRSDLKRLRP